MPVPVIAIYKEKEDNSMVGFIGSLANVVLAKMRDMTQLATRTWEAHPRVYS